MPNESIKGQPAAPWQVNLCSIPDRVLVIWGFSLYYCISYIDLHALMSCWACWACLACWKECLDTWVGMKETWTMESPRLSVWEGAQVATKLHAATQAHIVTHLLWWHLPRLLTFSKKMTFRDDVYNNMPSVREGAPGLPKLHAAAQGILVFASRHPCWSSSGPTKHLSR